VCTQLAQGSLAINNEYLPLTAVFETTCATTQKTLKVVFWILKKSKNVRIVSLNHSAFKTQLPEASTCSHQHHTLCSEMWTQENAT